QGTVDRFLNTQSIGRQSRYTNLESALVAVRRTARLRELRRNLVLEVVRVPLDAAIDQEAHDKE
ncbi:MAG: hypothetical protein L0Z62_39485, partial [Gemmataceae bacterium]|nr:hypothetical protein [Gemmataceae bacterium]